MKSPQPIYISAIGFYAPKKIVTNKDLEQKVETSDEWIYSHTGIRERRIAEGDEECSDLAVNAALHLFETTTSITKEMIDGIVVATATPDYRGFPSTACIVAEKLGIKGAAALDIGAGCTGFIYALEVARGMIMSGAMTKALVIGAEKLSTVVNWQDRNTCVLFGDGAGCVVLEKTEEHKGIIDSTLHAQGEGSRALTITKDTNTIAMDGRAVYAFAVKAIGETVLELLQRNDLTIEDITWIVPHQANKRIIAACSKRYGFDAERFYMNIDRFANTSAASIPIALAEMVERGLLKAGQKILFVGFGAGLTYGGTLIQW